MNKRFKTKHKTGNKNFVFLLLMIGFIIVLLFAYSSQFPDMQRKFDQEYKNINITFFDHSIQKENPSGMVLIDGQVVYQIDSISNSLFQNTSINLKKGKHTIEVSTIDKQYKFIDTIEVIDYPMIYNLWIQFHYNPPIDEYKEFVIDYLYQKSLQEKKHTKKQKIELLRKVREKTNVEFENGIKYEPSSRFFTFSFKDITQYPIE